MDPFSKVQRGMPLHIPAKAYNAFVDAARDHERRRMSTSADALRDPPPANIVLVKNESDADRARFDILGITGPIFTRADSAATFTDRIALRGVTPADEHAGRFVVLVDALPAGAIGRAYLAGVCLARVRMLDEAHTAADVDAGQAGQLASSAGGAASLLWVEPLAQRADPAIAWAVIRFGGVAAGGGERITALVVGHGAPVGDPPNPPGAEVGRIYAHVARAISGVPAGVPLADPEVDPPNPPLAYGLDDIIFYPLQPHGWFHPGAIVELFRQGGVWVARCDRFYGLVTKAAPVGASVPRGTVEVVPFDGNPGLVYSSPASITTFPVSELRRAATFPGCELYVGEPVVCLYVGCGGISPASHDADWLALNMPNLFGDPDASDYANAAPPAENMCVVTDDSLPVDPPTDDSGFGDEPVIEEVAP